MRIRQTTILMAVALLVGGCGLGDSPTVGSRPIEVSDALAFRDGEPKITIVSPSDGSLVISPISLQVRAENLLLRPAGETRDGEGHLHVLLDQGCVSAGDVIEVAPDAIHLGDGRSTAQIELSPGKHDICVQVGDGFHTAVEIVDRVSILVLDPADINNDLDQLGESRVDE